MPRPRSRTTSCAWNSLRGSSNAPLTDGRRPHLRTYQAHLLIERKLAPRRVRLHVCAIRFFFVKTLKRRYSLDNTPYPESYCYSGLAGKTDRPCTRSGSILRRNAYAGQRSLQTPVEADQPLHWQRALRK